MNESRITSHESRATALALCLALLAADAAAQVTTDPTRPPAGYDTAAPAAAGDADGAMRLQSVMISPTHKSAIISGVTVGLGEKYGDAVLVKVTENEVVLRSGGENQVLKLYPGIEKRAVKPAAQSASRHGSPKTGKPQR